MKHFIIFFYFLSFTAGFSFLLLGLFLWYQNKAEKLKYLILCGFALTLILVEQMITAYDIINVVKYKSLDIIIRNVSAIGCGLMVYSLTRLTLLVLMKPWAKKIKVVLIAASLFPIFIINVYHMTYTPNLLRIANIEYFGIVLCNIILLVGSLDKTENSIIKSAVRRFITISLLMFPLIFLDTLIERLPHIGIYFPFGLFTVFLYYVIFSSFCVYYFIRYFNSLLERSPVNDAKEEKDEQQEEGKLDKIIAVYNITNREKEIITLLVHGYSYRSISEKLVISLPTVKSHVYNIYKKLNIKNKIELINRIASQE